MRLRAVRRLALATSIGIAGLTLAAAPGGATNPVTVPQGPNWTPATRLQFYSQDQGSQIMPLVWFEALKQPNGQPFLGNSLSRYERFIDNRLGGKNTEGEERSERCCNDSIQVFTSREYWCEHCTGAFIDIAHQRAAHQCARPCR